MEHFEFVGGETKMKIDRVGQVFVFRCGDKSEARKMAEKYRQEGLLGFAQYSERCIAEIERLNGMVCVVTAELDAQDKLDFELDMSTCEVRFGDGSVKYASAAELLPLKKWRICNGDHRDKRQDRSRKEKS
jgi:hypothetical protein